MIPVAAEGNGRNSEPMGHASSDRVACIDVQPLGDEMRKGVSTAPTLVLVDRAGVVRLYNPGRPTMEQLEPRIIQLLD